MQITAITQHGVAGWPTLKLGPLTPGLNVVYGPPRSGKTMLAKLLAHSLFGKVPSPPPSSDAPPGEVIVQSDLGRHRVRRYRDAVGTPRLTVAALDGAAVDAGTMRGLVGGLSPAVLVPLCAVSFRESPDVAALLSADFARGYQAIGGRSPASSGRRTAELAARRDLLARELEMRIAGERRASKDLEARCRELDRSLRDEQQQAAVVEQDLRAVDTALAETDARLRYRRLEVNVERQRPLADPRMSDANRTDSDEHVARVRSMLSELAHREAAIRAQLADLQSAPVSGSASLQQTRAWLVVGRQLAADLAGEVARLARASASQQCVCRDAHPRLRPISETIERQLEVLETLLNEQQRSLAAAEMQTEVDQLAQSQAELRRHLDRLLERHHSHSCGDQRHGQSAFSAADAQQLESRRLELEERRFQLVEQLRTHTRHLRDLRAQRETVDRQRAALLSARSIEHVQRELTSVQQKLEQSTSGCGAAGEPTIADDNPVRASDFLAQLTDGGLVRLMLVEQGRRACVVDRAGQTLRVESLTASERDQVYLSLCLALLSAAGKQGTRLPLVLDEPFERLDARSAAALAAVLDDFRRQGHQVIVFTAQSTAVDRLASVGATVHEVVNLTRQSAATAAAPPMRPTAPSTQVVRKKRKIKKRSAGRPGNGNPAPQVLDNGVSSEDRSDAA
jgi:hypothetical protein